MRRIVFLLIGALGVFTIASGAALPVMRSLWSSTAGGYFTWDSDFINVESVSETGAGVYVAVLDTGLVPNWRDYFPVDRVATDLGTGFEQPVTFKVAGDNLCALAFEVGALHQTTWIGSTGSTHGTHVASTIIGYNYRSNFDAIAGFVLPAIQVRGIAPEVTIIPVKVLADHQIPARENCAEGPIPARVAVFGTLQTVAAGIDYVTDLAIAGYRPMVINMSLGRTTPNEVLEEAIDRAIDNGVIVVASAGDGDEEGMRWPGAYPQVISTGSAGWIGEYLKPGTYPPPLASNRYRMWWLQYPNAPLLSGSGDVNDPTAVGEVYVSEFSARALAGQELDVLAPGSWVRGPLPGYPGFAHLPWFSQGIGDLVGRTPTNFIYVGGTSMATPHVASAAALMLQKNPNLLQGEIEGFLEASALSLPGIDSRSIFDSDQTATISWDADCDGVVCDAVGAGLLQVDDAIGLVP
jgi:subtilisin family serine protease